MLNIKTYIANCTLALSTILLTQATLLAGDHCRKSCCPKCQTVCELKIEEGTETKHCWKTESKVVCIPRVTFSWQWPFQKHNKKSCDSGCTKPCCKPPKLARSRTVCVLVKHEYECPTCNYKWAPKEPEKCDCVETALPAPTSNHVSTKEVSQKGVPVTVATQNSTIELPRSKYDRTSDPVHVATGIQIRDYVHK